jgi:retinol dehydrogenase 12
MQSENPLSGKIALVTGATSGIGRVTAVELAKKGARVIVVGRNPSRVEDVVETIQKDGGSNLADGLVADLSNMSQVRSLAAQVLQSYPRLDILVNNAGALFNSRQTSADGFEMTFALNYLSPFLLTHLLLEMIKASAPARIVNVSSMAHVGARLNLQDLENTSRYFGWTAYGQSKLANLYFTYELARRLHDTHVTVNALHPGYVATNFGKGGHKIVNWAVAMSQVFAISPEEGAATSIYLASSPQVEGISGKYFIKKKAVQSSQISYNREISQQLWEVSEQMTGLV